MSRIVIIGGGFAGLGALRALVRKGHQITLIDKNPYTIFQPLLYQVAIGALSPGDIAFPLRRVTTRGGAKFVRGTVRAIDREAKVVRVTSGAQFDYDYLIIATGVGANYFGIPGAAEHSHTIYSRHEALAVRDAIFTGLEALASSGRRDVFTVAIVGGGATGVEIAGSLAELKTEGIPVVFPELATDQLHVVLIDRGPALLKPFAPRLRQYTRFQLSRRGVDVRLETSVKSVTAHEVALSDGTTVAADVVVWASGVAVNTAVANWGFPQGRGGRIEVDDTCRVRGSDHEFAVGDVAVNPDNPLPQLAQPALQMGRHAAEELLAAEAGRARRAFVYTDKGSMATIGRNAAVAHFPNGVALKGFPAWALWVGVHLATLLGGRNRIQAMVNTGFRYFNWPTSAVSIVGDSVTPSEPASLDTTADPVRETR